MRTTYVLLEREAERAIAERWRATREPAELQKLVESCLPWIYKQAARFARSSRTSCEDLVQAGIQGVCEAAWKFEPDRGHRFLTYARTWIHCLMQQAMTKDLVVRPPKVSPMVLVPSDPPSAG
jgi:DNA-directed RNA polymerase sigma subunit (sigma70/sigma32)